MALIIFEVEEKLINNNKKKKMKCKNNGCEY